ncbi:teichoic acid ABC transporter ATP-binding protein [Aliarcobacter trophiarum LMG 25534]|uniref:ABC transporter, ATP-binding protein n=1 Tax=Aliarcobacter trophiarum LMG 25534 TaxID=1032241 RepID=A0AAD0VMU9_9BACT|nr:ABC transporter ATP-binding protein [Aliarcobacter trophiarum]AXK49290.1 ABC transporter, ATP-binding protein [Aliarcobacter trophiarum LMG 25534]RXJ91430.1 teichoic acid ABC transporter ATP-binding protein [Aliarcobacter trophiarum LMG 25534]
MNKLTIVKVKNISKTYKLYNKPIDRVKETLNPFKKKYHKEFYALNDISFELKRGETLGIIGRNGNGKSTLLKIISGVLTPTKGHVNTKGKISAILELTSSLKPELTGLENIELNLKISGFNKNELKEKIKEIEEFAEIGEFITQPVKTYSSGMKSRLGFGIAISSKPDILILDEVLAVGDFNFQQKCLSKINAMRENISMIFVSHSMNSVRLFCDNVLVLEKGKKVFYGNADDGIKYYIEQEENEKQELNKKNTPKVVKPFYGDLFHNKEKIINVKHSWSKVMYKLQEEMILDFSFELKFDPKNLIIGLPIWDNLGNNITSFNSDFYKIRLFKDRYKIKGSLKTNCYFNPNEYSSMFVVVDGSEFLYRQLNKNFTVANRERVFGYVTLNHEWEING